MARVSAANAAGSFQKIQNTFGHILVRLRRFFGLAEQSFQGIRRTRLAPRGRHDLQQVRQWISDRLCHRQKLPDASQPQLQKVRINFRDVHRQKWNLSKRRTRGFIAHLVFGGARRRMGRSVGGRLGLRLRRTDDRRTDKNRHQHDRFRCGRHIIALSSGTLTAGAELDNSLMATAILHFDQLRSKRHRDDGKRRR